MPTYDYLCEATGQTVEVRHKMTDEPVTWGELVTAAGLDAGDIPLDSPVKRLATGGQVVKSGSLKDSAPAPCGAPVCCGGGCGIE